MDYCGHDISWQKKYVGSRKMKACWCISTSALKFFAAVFILLLAGCQSMYVATTDEQKLSRVTVEDLARQSIEDTNRRTDPGLRVEPKKDLASPARHISSSSRNAGKAPTQVPSTSATQETARSTQAERDDQVRLVQYEEDNWYLPDSAPTGTVQTQQADQTSFQISLPLSPVSDEFIETDVVEAIQSLASQARQTVILDENISGTVTASINEETFANAIQKICLPLGLHMRMRNSQLLICDGDPESAMFSLIAERLSYEPLHGTPEEISKMLPAQLLRYVRIANGRNMLIIEAPQEIARRIYLELSEYDQPVPQVVLEAMVVVISPDSGFQFGTDFGQSVSNSSGDFNLSLDGLALSGAWSGAAGQLFSRFATTSHFVRSLEQQGYLSIRATPHVMAKNGEKAEISIARETFFSTLPGNTQLLVRQDIQKVEAGITLEITPTIRGDNVLLAIDRAEVSEDIRSTLNDATLADPFPLINRRKVSTTVNVKDGETMVIGGLMQNQLVDRISKIPLLGDMPLFGRLFQKIDQQEAAAEVVVFISPRIVRQACDHPYPSGQLQSRFSDSTVLNPTPFGVSAASTASSDSRRVTIAKDLQHHPASDIASRNRIQSNNEQISQIPQNPQPDEATSTLSELRQAIRNSKQPTIVK